MKNWVCSKRRWCSKLTFFYKIINGLLPDYLHSYLDFSSQKFYPLRSVSNSTIKPFPSRTKTFKNTYFPFCINEWNNLDIKVRNAKSLNIFKKMIVSENKEKSIFSIYDPLGVKLITRLRLGLSHLNEHKFRHCFNDGVNAICACGHDVETTEHYLLRCHIFSNNRFKLFENLKKCEPNFLNLSAKDKVQFLLYGSQTTNSESNNQEILKNVIAFIKATGRFDRPLINSNQ